MGEVDGADYIGFYKNHGFTGFPEEIHQNIISRGWHESFFHSEMLSLPELWR